MVSEPTGARATAPSDPSELDKPWRRWASFIIVGMLGFSIVAGFIVIPVVQGWSAGISPFDAICRAVGITAGPPGRRRARSSAAAAPTTRVAWSTGLIRTLARPTPAGLEVAQQCVA